MIRRRANKNNVYDFIPRAVVEINEDEVQGFEDFWRCGVHGRNWRGDTHILYEFSTSPTTTAPRRGIITNAGQGGKHAEIKLMDKLKKRIKCSLYIHELKIIKKSCHFLQ